MEESAVSLEDKEFTCFSDAIAIHKERDDLSVETVKNIETAVEAGNWVELVKQIKQEASRTTVKIAVTGDSGNGMSSFINALREIGHEEEDSAPTGVVRTTQKPALYSSSKFPNVDLWDLPGTGVTSQSMENYLEEMDFGKYDLIIIIASEQFSSNHVKLAKALQSMRRRFYVVWTKLDRDLSTSALAEDQVRENILKNIRENLQEEGLVDPTIYLVSNFSPSFHDFPKLRHTLTKDLPEIKYDSLFGILFHVCEKIIDKKMKTIKKHIKEDNLQGGLEISDPNNLGECHKVFQKNFGVDDTSLRQVAVTMSHPDTYFTDVVQSQVTQTHQQDGSTPSLLHQFRDRAVQFAYRCFHLTHAQQEHVLDEAAEKTKKILSKILKDTLLP
ncbi:immunity-related GTPase family M protein 1-like [Arvicola amphibius]|uniref:immunity-related GTPase family M protein 1-like n=1 Tax=Arvicola amphibius TaxID=1047088 RepID=UPI0018E37385|nr:immunity-related GTPase family M protein 1-like [Arvicola amphibius]XP_038181935.1 immunity-related GTPase family M protein 1-like [Arvicola amphibius]